MKVLSLFSPRPVVALAPKGIGAQQHFKDDCDLNAIIAKYPDGVPPPRVMPTYGDFTAIGKGLQDQLNAYEFVAGWFRGLPATVRERFDNDPLLAQRWVLENPDGACDLGILSRVVDPARLADAEGVTGAKKRAVAQPPPAAEATPSAAPSVPADVSQPAAEGGK